MSFRRLLPLFVLLATAAAPPEQHLDIALSNFKFTPDRIVLRHGEAYVLHLSSSGGHSFAAKRFFAAATIASADRATIEDGKLELKGGESIDVHLVAPAPGSYPVKCTHLLHAGFGMTGTIVVE